MTEKEFMQRKTELYKQITALKREYVDTNIAVKPGRAVIIETAGNVKVWLHDYKVTGGHIDPIFYKLKPDGTPTKTRVYYSNRAKFREA